MSEVKDMDTSIISCASCGVAEVDDIKSKECSACDLVRYCSDACRDDHKSEHEESCKIRAAKLRDELLFKQPESTHQGDCPISFCLCRFINRNQPFGCVAVKLRVTDVMLLTKQHQWIRPVHLVHFVENLFQKLWSNLRNC